MAEAGGTQEELAMIMTVDSPTSGPNEEKKEGSTEPTKDQTDTKYSRERPNITESGLEEEKLERSTARKQSLQTSSGFRIIDTKLEISDLSEIDTASRTFRCRVKATLTWKLTEEEKSKIAEVKDNDNELEKYLSTVKYPEIDPWNVRDVDITFQLDPKVEISLNRDHHFCCTQLLTGHWQMDPDDKALNDFPFDHIKLPIYLYTKTGATDRFKIDIDAENAYTQKSIICRPSVSQEFNCYLAEVQTICESNETRRIYSGGLWIQIHAVRKWRYYANQVVIFIFFLSLMVLPGYVIHVNDVSDRLSHFLTLLLAQTALLYFVGGSLPKLSYFSILDEYLIWNFILTLGCSLQSAFINKIENNKLVIFIDEICFYVVIAAFFILNAFYGFDSFRTSKRNRKKKFAERLKLEANPDYFVSPDYKQSDFGGVCVYHSHDWSDLGEYRDWRKTNKQFEKGKFVLLDKVVVLFEDDDVPLFREQNNII